MSAHQEQQLTALAALGKLDELEARRLAAHLPRCAQCREELAEMQALTALLGRRPAPALPTPRRRLPLVALASGAAAALVAGVVVVVGGGGSAPAPRQVELAAAAGAPRAQGLVTLTRGATATAVTVRVGGLPEHEWCTVFVTDRAGHRSQVLRWVADYEGSSRVRGSTTVAPADVAAIDVVDDHGLELLRSRT